MQTAWLNTKLDGGKIRCDACAHFCVLSDGEIGKCGVRKVVDGELSLEIYGLLSAINIDPIEKKPLYHMLPSSAILSVGTIGCNFTCDFCQNYELSQYPKEHNYEVAGKYVSPKELVDTALSKNIPSIAFTYNEPVIYYEYAYDVMKLAHENNIKTVFVTSGYESKKTIETSTQLIDAMNIDLKSFNDDFYKDICGARLKPVLECIENAKKAGIWVEITTLLIEGKNDSDKEIEEICKFIKSIDREIPLHFSAFHGAYKMKDVPPTSHETLNRAYDIAKDLHLEYVYVGNILDDERQNTYCPACGELVIERSGYLGEHVENKMVRTNHCPRCGYTIKGIF
ncbi:MAG: AmmeMemoRadiSam system radical SAM enzyme [Campylobacterales bacterium]|nr:AmmeMemoRadiSam system radical SAM enzyme [Campylobacterales bacterium]